MISKSQKIGLGLLLAGVVVGAGAGAVAVKETNNSQERIKATGTSHSVRVYAALLGAWDTVDSSIHMYIHFDGGASGNTTWGACPEMTKVISDYYSGLYYYDLPSNDFTTLVFKNTTGDVSKTSNQSADCTLASAFPTSPEAYYYVYKVQAWAADGTKRVVNEETCGVSLAQFGSILSSDHYTTCDSSYANGYNGYAQLNGAFLSASDAAIPNDTSFAVKTTDGSSTTVKNKLATMKRLAGI